VPLTGAMCLSVACQIPGTIPQVLARLNDANGDVRVGHPSGASSLGAKLAYREGWVAESAIVYRTARKLMQGAVVIPEAAAC
jgi:2-methylaconitate cis-trans-isomerase PrpF